MLGAQLRAQLHIELQCKLLEAGLQGQLLNQGPQGQLPLQLHAEVAVLESCTPVQGSAGAQAGCSRCLSCFAAGLWPPGCRQSALRRTAALSAGCPPLLLRPEAAIAD